MVGEVAGNHGAAVFCATPPGDASAADRLFRRGTRKSIGGGAAGLSKPRICGLRCDGFEERGDAALAAEIDAEFFQLLGVVAPVQDIVLFPALGNFALLSADFFTRGGVDAMLELQQVGHFAN